MPNGTWSGTPPTCVKGTFSTGGFWSSFLVFVQHKSHIMHFCFFVFLSVFFLSSHILMQAKQVRSGVPHHPNCSMAITDLFLTQLEMHRRLSFSVKTPSF